MNSEKPRAYQVEVTQEETGLVMRWIDVSQEQLDWLMERERSPKEAMEQLGSPSLIYMKETGTGVTFDAPRPSASPDNLAAAVRSMWTAIWIMVSIVVVDLLIWVMRVWTTGS